MGRLRRSPSTRATVASLLGDIDEIVNSIYAELAEDDVVVWAGSGVEVCYARVREAPESGGEHVGTYRMGVAPTDIRDDLLELRKSRVSDAMLF